MFAPEFDYYKASSIEEAIQLLGSYGGAKLIAGGQSLIPLLKLRLARPTALIDIGGIADLKRITVDQGIVRIGALATHWDIASSQDGLMPVPCWRRWPEVSGTHKFETGALSVAM